jgi:hypothetical protein
MVQELMKGLDHRNGWAKGYDYIVWLDPYTVILDHNHDLIQILSQYPNGQIFMGSLKEEDINQKSFQYDTFSIHHSMNIMIFKNHKYIHEFLYHWYGDTNDDMEDDEIYHQSIVSKYDYNYGIYGRFVDVMTMYMTGKLKSGLKYTLGYTHNNVIHEKFIFLSNKNDNSQEDTMMRSYYQYPIPHIDALPEQSVELGSNLAKEIFAHHCHISSPTCKAIEGKRDHDTAMKLY